MFSILFFINQKTLSPIYSQYLNVNQPKKFHTTGDIFDLMRQSQHTTIQNSHYILPIFIYIPDNLN